jgi:hypothetical protein
MAKLTWTVEISVEKLWVSDGFELTDERAQDMVLNDLQFAMGHEVKCKVIKTPDREIVAKLQGYKSYKDKAQRTGVKRIRPTRLQEEK